MMRPNNSSPELIQGQLTNKNIHIGEAQAALLSAITCISSKDLCEHLES